MRVSATVVTAAMVLCAGSALMMRPALNQAIEESGAPIAGRLARGVFCSSEDGAQAVAHARSRPSGIERARMMVALLQGLAGNYHGSEWWCSWSEYTITIVGERRGERVWEVVVDKDVSTSPSRERYHIRIPLYFVGGTEAAEMPTSVAYDCAYSR